MNDRLPHEKGFHVSWDQLHRDARALAWRLEQGLSQEAAAAPLGYHQASWSGWETGDKTPPLEVAARLELLTEGRVRVEHFGYDPEPALALASAPWRSTDEAAQ